MAGSTVTRDVNCNACKVCMSDDCWEKGLVMVMLCGSSPSTASGLWQIEGNDVDTSLIPIRHLGRTGAEY